MSVELESILSGFLKNNPWSSVASADFGNGEIETFIETPWGDSSLGIFPSESKDSKKLSVSLNNCILPKEFSAVYHINDKVLELAWTAMELGGAFSSVSNRDFTFHYRNKKLKCRFAKSSDELKIITASCIPMGPPSPTFFRNTGSFYRYANPEKFEKVHNRLALDEPRSFFIENFKLDSNSIYVIESINFYIRYFDRESPVILIHRDFNREDEYKPNRYIEGSFPNDLFTSDIDENILSFWSASFDAENEILQYMLFYRIIEYISVSYSQDKHNQEMKKILSKPSAFSNTNKTLEKILQLSSEIGAQDEYNKYTSLMRECVSPSSLWVEISRNKKFFEKPIKFDGGYALKEVVSKDMTESGFEATGFDAFIHAARKLRNVLSHGKDAGSTGVIRPTPANLRKLKPWVHLIERAAGDVVAHHRKF